MARRKRKLTAAEKREKKRRRLEFMTIFVNGKQKRLRRPPNIDGMDPDEFIRRSADPIWLAQNGMWEELYALEQTQTSEWANPSKPRDETTGPARGDASEEREHLEQPGPPPTCGEYDPDDEIPF